ncbi:MAG: hypothetical protein HYX92_16300 [Chloroflexi bacterium]|nr:hypothetical protein [Chloroflexota bacterium]
MKQETYRASAIRHLAPSLDGDLIAAALFEHTVSIWSLETGKRISEFDTILDSGDRRLAFSEANSLCLAAAYYRHGLACYDTRDGSLRWQRKDVKKVQQLVLSPDQHLVYCCREEGACQVVTLTEGGTARAIRGVREIWVARSGDLQFHCADGLRVVVSSGVVKFRFEPETFAVLSADFSKDFLAVSESGGSVRIFDLGSGDLVYRYAPPQGEHILKIAAGPDRRVFYCVQWPYSHGGPKVLLRVDPKEPEPQQIAVIPRAPEIAFCRNGSQLLTSEGDLLDCRSGEIVMRFDFPQREYPKN